jgi:mono/diheme cytochrome c family protein
MKSLWILLSIPLLVVLAACGRASAIPPTNLAPTPRAVGTATVEAATAIAAAAADSGAAAVEVVDGDPAAGEAIFNQLYEEVAFSCANCHNPATEDRLIGPGLQHVGQRAATRQPGVSAVEYLRASILHPDDYVVESYPNNLMPETYADLLDEQQLNDLLAYLLSL